jgi:aromatic ring-opening dioxygenase LigB subunit
MLVFCAIVPHSPLLAPKVGKEKRDMLAATLRACAEVEERLYTLQVENIVIMSPHAPVYPDAFSANAWPSYTGTLKTFGDYETSVSIRGNIPLLDLIQKRLRESGKTPFTLSSSEEIDYGYTVPLLLLTRHLRHARLVPVAPSLLDARMHAEFGRRLRDVLEEHDSRIAFIASADLSHKLDERSPGGANVEGPAFDATVRGKLKTLDLEGLLAMDAEAVEAAGQCGYRPIVTLVGLLHDTDAKPAELCYEKPFGVGYLTEIFEWT